MVKKILLTAAFGLIRKHGSSAPSWAAEQARALRAAGDIKGSQVFECLEDCVAHVLSRGIVPTVH